MQSFISEQLTSPCLGPSSKSRMLTETAEAIEEVRVRFGKDVWRRFPEKWFILGKPVVWIARLLPEFEPLSKFNIESPCMRTESRSGDITYKDLVSFLSLKRRVSCGVKEPMVIGCQENLSFVFLCLFLFRYTSSRCLLFILLWGGVLNERCNSSLLFDKNERRFSSNSSSISMSSTSNRSESSGSSSGCTSEIKSTPVSIKYSRLP